MRADVGHIHEWITYQAALGVEKVFLRYDVAAKDSDGGVGPDGRWLKKPNAPMLEWMSDTDVVNLLHHEVEKASRETGIAVDILPCRVVGSRVDQRQRRGFNDALENAGMREFDWVLFLDVDELLVCPGGLKEYLGGLPSDVGSVRVKQLLFDSRFSHGVCIPMMSITNCYGRPKGVFKGIYKPSMMHWLRNVHCRCRSTGHKAKPTSDTIRYCHFRGLVDEPDNVRHYRGFRAGEKEPYANRDHINQGSAISR
jgi:hypothetical protein